MSGPPAAVAATRVAVRRWLAAADLADETPLTVAVSGGADSLALCAAAVFETRGRCGVRAVTVDHGLQPGSAERAAEVAALCRTIGATAAEVVTVTVERRDGPEADARTARYAALGARADAWVLLGHTLDDQAETVLLGLGRGSGPRSIAGMVGHAEPWGRPFLGVRRAETQAACAALGLPVWADPHNDDPRYTRVRLRREVLPLLDDVLGGGVPEALARTADQLRELETALAAYAAQALRTLVADDGLVCGPDLADLPTAVRVRVIGEWLRAADATGLNAAQLGAIDRLVVGYHGQGPVAVPRGELVVRRHGRLALIRSAQPQEGDPRVRR